MFEKMSDDEIRKYAHDHGYNGPYTIEICRSCGVNYSDINGLWKNATILESCKHCAPLDTIETDGTDYAHPAWFRGQEDGVRGTVMRIRQALDNPPTGGVNSCDELNKVIAEIHELKEDIENLKHELSEITKQRDYLGKLHDKANCEKQLRECGCMSSGGICGAVTVGKGELSNSGYWENPCWRCARAWDVVNPQYAPHWPYSVDKS